MTGIDVRLRGGDDDTLVRITALGQVVTSPYDYDGIAFQKLTTTGVFNFYKPKPGKQFVITGIRIKATRSVSNTVDAEITIYEGGSVDDAAVARILFEDALIRGESGGLAPLNILVNEGVFINATTTEASMFINIVGYYRPRTPRAART